MWRFLGYFLLACLVIYIIQLFMVVGLVLLVIAGLIFRPRETIGLIAILGYIRLLGAFPMPTLLGTAVLVTILLVLKAKNKREAVAKDEAALALPAPDDK